MKRAAAGDKATDGEMRLICPNCGAQYEVPDEVVPERGRDVQCSNCGDTWFQTHPDHSRQSDKEDSLAEESPLVEEEQPLDQDQEDDQADWVEPDEDEEDTVFPAEESPARRELDPDVASVLREEASRENEARAAERGGLETQPDLGLEPSQDEADMRSHQAKARMARLRGVATPEEEPKDDDDIDPGNRRGLLPDIDDINSTISSANDSEKRDTSARDGSKVATPPRSTGGFRRGLRLAVLLAIIATAVYIFSPQIAELVPAAEGPLITYVEMVNQWRAQLNEAVAPLIAQVQGMIGG